MNMSRNAGRRVCEAVVGGNQAPPQAPTVVDQVHVNPARLTDGEVREALLQMEQSITTQAQEITTQAAREGAPGRNHMLAPWLVG